jgi:DNA-directed RNA polymerase subunit omega
LYLFFGSWPAYGDWGSAPLAQQFSDGCGRSSKIINSRTNKSIDSDLGQTQINNSVFCPPMLVSNIIPPVVSGSRPTILQFPTDATRAVRSLRNMTTQLLQEAAQVIPNQQLLINVVSRRVRQLGLGHRPLVEATPRSSLTDIALREIIAGKLTYELAPEKPAADGAA